MKPIIKFLTFTLFLSFAMFSSCVTPGEAAAHNDGSVLKPTQIGAEDLTYYIKQLPGVLVRGSGPAATITVRGTASVLMDPSPLFVLDGTPMGTDYGQIYDSVNPDQIKRIEVLKDASETSLYGMRGAMGVIEITRK